MMRGCNAFVSVKVMNTAVGEAKDDRKLSEIPLPKETTKCRKLNYIRHKATRVVLLWLMQEVVYLLLFCAETTL